MPVAADPDSEVIFAPLPCLRSWGSDSVAGSISRVYL
jgi:hypothetical protein